MTSSPMCRGSMISSCNRKAHDIISIEPAPSSWYLHVTLRSMTSSPGRRYREEPTAPAPLCRKKYDFLGVRESQRNPSPTQTLPFQGASAKIARLPTEPAVSRHQSRNTKTNLQIVYDLKLKRQVQMRRGWIKSANLWWLCKKLPQAKILKCTSLLYTIYNMF